MKKSAAIILSFFLLISFTSCTSSANCKLYSKSFFDCFNTASTISACDISQNQFDKNYDKIVKLIGEYSKLYDIYNSYGDLHNLKFVNENAYKSPVKVDRKIIDLLLFGKEAYNITNGLTNICFGSVLSAWHDSREYSLKNPKKAYIPNTKTLTKLSLHTDIKNLVIDEKNSTVYFKDNKMTLDVGAIAKGFVCDEIAKYITANSIWESAVISLGGNIKTIGYKNNNEGSKFIIGVESPNNSSVNSVRVKVANGESVVTSNGKQRYYAYKNKNYSHIINPETLMPAESVLSATVISDNSALADALSTALFCMDAEEGMKLVNSLENVEAIWVDLDNNIIYSPGVNRA